MKIVDGAWCRPSSKRTRTSFSESPRHLETMDEAEMLKKVVLHSVATAWEQRAGMRCDVSMHAM